MARADKHKISLPERANRSLPGNISLKGHDMRKAILFHDGCGICLGIASMMNGLFDPQTVFSKRSISVGNRAASATRKLLA
jgi:hypothetical protein